MHVPTTFEIHRDTMAVDQANDTGFTIFSFGWKRGDRARDEGTQVYM